MNSAENVKPMEGETLAAYLRRVRAVRGLTQWDIAHALGTDQSRVSKLERGATKRPAAEVAIALARALDVSPEYLLRLSGHPVQAVLGEEGVVIPVRGVVPANALRFSTGEGAVLSTVRVLSDDLAAARSPLSDLFALEVSGDCMRSLGIWHGDLVIVEPAQGRPPRENQLVVVRVGDEVSLKRWHVKDGVTLLQDGDGVTVYRVRPGDDIEVLAFYVTWKPVAPRQ